MNVLLHIPMNGDKKKNYRLADSVALQFRVRGCVVSESLMRVQWEWQGLGGLLSPEGTTVT